MFRSVELEITIPGYITGFPQHADFQAKLQDVLGVDRIESKEPPAEKISGDTIHTITVYAGEETQLNKADSTVFFYGGLSNTINQVRTYISGLGCRVSRMHPGTADLEEVPGSSDAHQQFSFHKWHNTQLVFSPPAGTKGIASEITKSATTELQEHLKRPHVRIVAPSGFGGPREVRVALQKAFRIDTLFVARPDDNTPDGDQSYVLLGAVLCEDTRCVSIHEGPAIPITCMNEILQASGLRAAKWDAMLHDEKLTDAAESTEEIDASK